MAELTKEEVLAIALSDYRKNLPTPDNDGGAKPFDWGEAMPMVTCPDGTKSIANGFLPPCMGQYGNKKPYINSINTEEQLKFAEMQKITKQLQEEQKANSNSQAPTKNRDSISKSLFKKIAGSYNQNLIIAGVLVAGYFAYKKFKK